VNRKGEKMKIEILGTGCPKCKKLYEECQKGIAASEAAVTLEKVENIDDIISYGVMMTPALVVDGVVKATGRIVPSTEIAAMIAERAGR